MRLLCAALFVCSPSGPDARAQGAGRVPRFEDYPAERVYRGRGARVVLKDRDRAFRTRLREAAKGRSNFGGRHILTAWGCGTGCLAGALIDAKTGLVYWFPRQAYADYDAPPDFEPVRFRADSLLLVIFGAREEADESGLGTYYYHFDRGRFRLVRFVPKARRE